MRLWPYDKIYIYYKSRDGVAKRKRYCQPLRNAAIERYQAQLHALIQEESERRRLERDREILSKTVMRPLYDGEC